MFVTKFFRFGYGLETYLVHCEGWKFPGCVFENYVYAVTADEVPADAIPCGVVFVLAIHTPDGTRLVIDKPSLITAEECRDT